MPVPADEGNRLALEVIEPARSIPLNIAISEHAELFNIPVQGQITDELGEPLIGVNILVDGTNIGTSTDIDGKYALDNVPEDAVLVISYIGFIQQEVELDGRSMVDIILLSNDQILDQVVVVGYGTVKKRDLTGSVATLDGAQFDNQQITQVSEMLTGTIAGFYGNQSTSAAGGSSLEVRGPNSLTASSSPLIVLDGVIYQGSLSDINPSDIENIDILKDASSAAVFGARSASGVVIITTKKGKSGKPIIRLNTQVGLTTPTGKVEHFQGEEYMTYRADVLRAINPDLPSFYYDNPNALSEGVSLEQWRSASANPNADQTDEWLARLNFFQIEEDNFKAGNVVNWYDQVMQRGFRQNYDLSLSGGTDDLSYYWSVGYQNNEGIIRGDQFSTLRSRLNLEYTVSDWLDVGLNTQFSNRDQGSVPASVGNMYRMSPYGSIFEDDGSVRWFPNSFIVRNPLINFYGQDRLNRANTMFSALYTNVKLPFGLSYKFSFQPRFEFEKDYNFWSSNTIVGGEDNSGGFASREDDSEYGWLIDNILSWQKEFGVHRFDVTMLYSVEKNQGWSSFLRNQAFVPNENLGFGGVAFGTNPELGSNDFVTTGDAALLRVNYTLLDKYLITASIRRDGYSAFGSKFPRATFPAVALAWRVSDESFFNSNLIDDLKLRLSYGVNGNREIGAYASLAQLASTLYYNNSVQVGVFSNTLANSDLRWEKTSSFNLGVDLGFNEGKITVSADFYKMNTTDLLLNRLLPEISGYESVTANLGELSNTGVDITINTHNIHTEKVHWQSNLVFSLNRNKIEELFGDVGTYTLEGNEITGEVPDFSNEWFPGHAIDHIWDYDVTGIWQLDEAEEASRYRLKPGDFKATDVNDDGAFEAVEDKQFIGYSRPRFRLGLRNQVSFMKNWEAAIFIRADLGHLGSFSRGLRQGGIDTYDRRNTYKTPYWTPENPINDYPSLTNNFSVFGGGLGLYRPRSFVRVQDVSLSYKVPEKIASLLKSQSIRAYVSARNVLTFDKWPGWDPESLDDPMPKTYTFGLNIVLE